MIPDSDRSQLYFGWTVNDKNISDWPGKGSEAGQQLFLHLEEQLVCSLWKQEVPTFQRGRNIFLRNFKFYSWTRICKRLRIPGIDSKESIPPAYVAWRSGTMITYLSNRPARLHRLGFLNVYKYGLCSTFLLFPVSPALYLSCTTVCNVYVSSSFISVHSCSPLSHFSLFLPFIRRKN